MTRPIPPSTPPDTQSRSPSDLWEMLHQTFGSDAPQDLLAHLLDRVEARP